MPRKKDASASSSTRHGVRSQVKAKWIDPDDAPELTDDLLDRAELRDGDRIVRRGRPPLGDEPKSAVTLRLDTDILRSYRETGPGWQSRINDDLRRARKLKKA
jgi:uncharacterized protein (DUF4415 family)